MYYLENNAIQATSEINAAQVVTEIAQDDAPALATALLEQLASTNCHTDCQD